MEGHFILCGLGRIGSRVLTYLRATGVQVVVVDTKCAQAGAPPEGVTYLADDFRKEAVLRAADVDRARGILILTSDDLVNLAAALLVRNLNPRARVVVRMFNPGLISRLGQVAGNMTALSASSLTAPIMALIARTGAALGEFSTGGKAMQIAEAVIQPGSPLVGVTLGELTGRHAVLLVGHRPANGTYTFNHRVNLAALLAPEDRLIVCGPPAEVAGLERRGEMDVAPDLLWAGIVRRHLRVVGRVLAEINLAVKICTIVLVVVVVVSTLFFHWSMERESLARAFYRTISLMATTSDMGLKELHPELEWQRFYVGALRLIGAVLMAAFTAIFTNYLIRAQLQGALEVRRIPESGHIVVCGLGNVGYRIVEELMRADENVVAIERAVQNPFIATVRRRRVAVIIGDAVVLEVLKEAHVANARAVVVATDNDLVNVEAALLVRQLNPAQRVVLRLTDTHLAATLREAANIRLAVSIPDLSAPAFVAALFGDRVHSVFFVQGHLLAVVDLVVADESDHMLGQPVQQLTADYNLQPIALLGAGDKVKDNPLGAHLELGDRLTVIVDLSDLQRLLQKGG